MIRALFMQRKQRHPGEYAPELLTAWDEWKIADYPEGWDADVERCKAEQEGEAQSFAVIDIDVPLRSIDAILNRQIPKISGSVK